MQSMSLRLSCWQAASAVSLSNPVKRARYRTLSPFWTRSVSGWPAASASLALSCAVLKCCLASSSLSKAPIWINHTFCAFAGACGAAIWDFTGALTVSALAGSTPTPVNIFVASVSSGLNLACSEKASATEVWAIGIGLADALSDRSTGGADGNQRTATCALGCGVIVATGAGSGIGASDADCTELVWMVMVFTDRD